MTMTRRFATAGATLLGVGVAALIAAPAASAFTVEPAPGGGTVRLTSPEAAVVGNANIAPLVDAVTPGWGRGAKYHRTFGQTLDSNADVVGQYPPGTLSVTVNVPTQWWYVGTAR